MALFMMRGQFGATVQFSDGSRVVFDPGKAASVPDKFVNEAERMGLQRVGETPSGTTAQRPTGADLTVGASYWDTSLGKPVWYNGSVWKDATGATV